MHPLKNVYTSLSGAPQKFGAPQTGPRKKVWNRAPLLLTPALVTSVDCVHLCDFAMAENASCDL